MNNKEQLDAQYAQKLGASSISSCVPSQGLGGALQNNSFDYGCRISLREQIHGRLHQAKQSADEAYKLSELGRLIDAHPETFQMISLMRDLSLF